MVVTVDADDTVILFQRLVRPRQIFIQVDIAVFTVLTAVTPDKASDSHADIRMDLPEKGPVEREIQDTPHNAVAAIRFRDSVTVPEIDALAL